MHTYSNLETYTEAALRILVFSDDKAVSRG